MTQRNALPPSPHPSLATVAASMALALGLSACCAPQARGPAAAPPSAPSEAAAQSAANPAAPPEAPAADAVAPPSPPLLSYTKPLAGVTSMEQALAKVKKALADRGFGIITEIDVQTVMKKKLGVDMRPFWILGACNPKKAHQAIEGDPQMGLLLPCKVIVYQQADGAFIVALARPKTIFGLVDHPKMSTLADDVDASFRQAFDAL